MLVFLFKQKTAYDMRISDWSSDVCSSDLRRAAAEVLRGRRIAEGVRLTVIPATQAIYRQALQEGLITIFAQAGATVAAGICGPCSGVYTPLDASDVCLSTATRTDPGRMGKIGRAACRGRVCQYG